MSRLGAGIAWVGAWSILAAAGAGAGEAALLPQKTEGKHPPFIERLKAEVPPLKHTRGNRSPMILWECVSFKPEAPEVYKALLDRGIAQNIQMDAKMIATAQAIQKAGSPVIMMNGAGGPWPYNQAPNWEHQFVEGYKPPEVKGWWASWKACPMVFEGWRVNADKIRETLRKFKEAGVTIDAVWMDWEGEPLSTGVKEGWEAATHCKRCRETLPPAVLRDEKLWHGFCRRLNNDLIAAYLAAPARDVFPRCSVTNWMAVISTPQHTVLGWENNRAEPEVPAMLTATNPVAYGNDVFWRFWDKAWPVDQAHVDRFYMHLLLREISEDAANRAVYAPEKHCAPWVARWCPDTEDPKVPMMSRPAYREALRHIWLRGAEAMQVFNPTRKGYEDIAFAETADAVAVYDEMLAYARFLDQGEVMCCDAPGVQDDGVLWSGLRLGDEAVVRAIRQGEPAAKIKIEPWPGVAAEIEAPPEGATFIIRRDGAAAHATRQ